MDVGAADSAGVVGVGIIVGSTDALGVGATAFPSPIDDMDAEWLWHGLFAMRAVAGTQTDTDGGQYRSREIDSKAMRRFKQNEQPVIMVDSSILSSSPTFDVVIGVRMLVAL